MKLLIKKLFPTLVFAILLSGCNPAILQYQLDPEITHLDQLPEETKIVALKVVDARVAHESNENNQNIVTGPTDEIKVIEKKLTDFLKQAGYKIISKPLLADLSFEIEINTLQLSLESSTFKSTIGGKSEIKLTVNKRGEQWSKIFRATREQEVANPVNDLDVTGVVNQMLTKQFSSMFSDQSLKDFFSKNNNL